MPAAVSRNCYRHAVEASFSARDPQVVQGDMPELALTAGSLLTHVPSASKRVWATLSLLALPLSPACTTASAETAGRAAHPATSVPAKAEPRVASPAATPRHPQAAQAAQAAQAGTPRSLLYDLAAHADHAELRHGSELLIDFGIPSDAKYTLGGWGTRMLRGATIDGATAAFVRGSYGDILLPVHFDGSGSIAFRACAPRNGEITVYLDEKVLARVKTSPDEFEITQLEVPAEKLGKREHMLRLRGSGMGTLGAHSTAIAIDWVSVAPAGTVATPPPALATSSTNLTVPAGFSLGFALAVQTGARLEAKVNGAAHAKLRALAVLDDLSVRELGSAPAGGTLDVDLSSVAARVARIDLSAEGDITLVAPRITLPAETQPALLPKQVRNVLVYLVDTLRADHLRPFNANTRVKTPGLDALVETGVALFTSAHTQENWTKPSVATLLSSLMPWEHKAVTMEAVVPASVQLLPELLRERGFRTGAFIANGYVSDKFGFNQGWDTYRNYIREGRYSRAEFLANDVVAWLDKRPQKQPFFLYVHAIDPHVPYKPTAEFLSLYDPLPYQGVVDFSHDTTLLEKIKIGDIRLNGRDKVHLEALYDSEISYHDVHFRSILAALDKRGLTEDTMIVLVADHGEEFWDHGSVGHGHSVYEELLHIPMLVRVPGVTREPVRITSAVGLVDVMPTVLEAIGEPLPAGLSGRSLLSEIRGQRPSAPRVSVSGFMDGWRTALVGDLKLIQRTEKRVMLHDLASDPHEQTDVAASRPISVRYARGQLGLALAATEQGDARELKKPVHREEKTKIDAATKAQLKALGYVQ